jgi:hypothetical protein
LKLIPGPKGGSEVAVSFCLPFYFGDKRLGPVVLGLIVGSVILGRAHIHVIILPLTFPVGIIIVPAADPGILHGRYVHIWGSSSTYVCFLGLAVSVIKIVSHDIAPYCLIIL